LYIIDRKRNSGEKIGTEKRELYTRWGSHRLRYVYMTSEGDLAKAQQFVRPKDRENAIRQELFKSNKQS
jgi:hypothetical protein